MCKKTFFKNFGGILLFAFVGTRISIIIVSFGTYYLGQLGYMTALTMKESWAFGSLISATDPVSVLAIFKELGADARLNSLVFGESVMNDAVAMVIYNTIVKIDVTQPLQNQLGGSVLDFTIVVLGSVLIGALSAIIVAFLLKK